MVIRIDSPFRSTGLGSITTLKVGGGQVDAALAPSASSTPAVDSTSEEASVSAAQNASDGLEVLERAAQGQFEIEQLLQQAKALAEEALGTDVRAVRLVQLDRAYQDILGGSTMWLKPRNTMA